MSHINSAGVRFGSHSMGNRQKMKSLTSLTVFIGLVIGQSSGIEQTSALRDALLAGYNKDAKPDGQVEVKAGLSLTTLDLCPHRQVQ